MKFRLLIPLLFLCSACGMGGINQEEKFNTPLTSGCKSAAVQDQFLVQWKDGRTTVENAPSREEFIQRFLNEHGNEIQFAEHDYVVTVDPVESGSSGEVESMDLDPEDWGQKDSEADWAWTNNMHGQGVMVGVVDSGADKNHPQLKNQMYTNPGEVIDGIDNDENGYVDDVNGWDFVHWTPEITGDTLHGTHVSGIVLADHGVAGMKGVAPAAELLPLKFIDGNAGFLSNAIYAIDYAVNLAKKANKPLVVNASWGGSDCSLSLRAKMDEFKTRRVLFAVAAGNNGRNISTTPIYPAVFNLESQITVAAHSARDVLATFSNYGPKVDLSAPGLDIFSLAPSGKYVRLDGTSMATPFVAGTAALLWGAYPNATTAQVRKAIFDSVETGHFNVRLQGKLNVRKAKLALDQM